MIDAGIPNPLANDSGGSDDTPPFDLWPAPDAPWEVADGLYQPFRSGDLRTLVHWRGDWMRWTGQHWAQMDIAELRSHVYHQLGRAHYIPTRGTDTEPRSWNPDKRKVSFALEALAATGHVPSSLDPPVWIDTSSSEGRSATQIIACRNGLLDLESRELREHTAGLFNLVSVPFDYDSNAGEPRAWLRFLDSAWPNEPQSVALLQEYVGYILSGRTDMQKLLLLLGPTRSGKGTIARVVTELVGRLNAVGPTLASLGSNFGLAPLLGKTLAIISDARLGDTPSHNVVERLLSITGEDMLTVDRKYREPWTGKMPTRFLVLSNELPKFRDSSGAIANRMLILQMTQSFLGREDRTLDARLKEELPSILLWALEGLDRLTATGRFTVPDASREASALMMDLASPVSAYVRDKCETGPGNSVAVDVLYESWRAWAEANGHHAGSKPTFGRNIRSVVPSIRNSQRTIGAERVRHYDGIGFKSPALSGEQGVQPVQSAVTNGFARAGIDAETQVKPLRTGSTGMAALRPLLGDYPCRDGCGGVAPAGRLRCDRCRRSYEITMRGCES